jgi:hypothetical protein
MGPAFATSGHYKVGARPGKQAAAAGVTISNPDHNLLKMRPHADPKLGS